MNKPYYPHKPIGDLTRLALALGIELDDLLKLKEQSDSLFFQTRKITKPDGSHRITYDARPSLKTIHGKICEAFLKKVHYPNYLQGSLKKRDYITDAIKHTSSKVLISEDVTNFFPSISKKVVHEVWVGVFGFSNEVAECLADLVTFQEAVPQGAKTSSYICNLALWDREAELVDELQKNELVYSRYVDDITVSSKRILSKKEKSAVVSKIYALLRSIGTRPNRKKHKIMPRNSRQEVHGVNINRTKVTMPKKKRDQIRSAVHECEKEHSRAPHSQEYQDLFNSTLGRVNSMGRLHKREADKLRNRLTLVKPEQG